MHNAQDWPDERAFRQSLHECQADEAAHDEISRRHLNVLSWVVIAFAVLYVVLQLGRLWGRTEAEEFHRQQDVIWEDRRP